MASMAHIEGLDQLRRALRNLPANVQKNVLARSVGKGADVLMAEAKSRAPVLSEPSLRRKVGVLRDAIYAVVGKRSASQDEAAAFVAIRKLTSRAVARFKGRTGKSASDNPNDPFYWKFLEFGTSKMRARPFIRPAFDAKKEAAVAAIADDLRKGVQDEAAKLSWNL